MKCGQCGCDVHPGAKFCGKCGAPIPEQYQTQAPVNASQNRASSQHTPVTPSGNGADGGMAVRGLACIFALAFIVMTIFWIRDAIGQVQHTYELYDKYQIFGIFSVMDVVFSLLLPVMSALVAGLYVKMAVRPQKTDSTFKYILIPEAISLVIIIIDGVQFLLAISSDPFFRERWSYIPLHYAAMEIFKFFWGNYKYDIIYLLICLISTVIAYSVLRANGYLKQNAYMAQPLAATGNVPAADMSAQEQAAEEKTVPAAEDAETKNSEKQVLPEVPPPAGHPFLKGVAVLLAVIFFCLALFRGYNTYEVLRDMPDAVERMQFFWTDDDTVSLFYGIESLFMVASVAMTVLMFVSYLGIASENSGVRKKFKMIAAAALVIAARMIYAVVFFYKFEGDLIKGLFWDGKEEAFETFCEIYSGDITFTIVAIVTAIIFYIIICCCYDGNEQQETNETGIMKTNRSIWVYILLDILTCGIYHFYTIYALARDVNIMCEDDGEHTGGLAAYIFLSIITCGLYSFYWSYRLGNRLAQNGYRWGLPVPENGTTVLLWNVVGLLLCGLGPLFAMNILLKNTNQLSMYYNRKS